MDWPGLGLGLGLGPGVDWPGLGLGLGLGPRLGVVGPQREFVVSGKP